MIIVRTPFRISFFGGGTDYPSWYLDNGGAVVSATINKFSYLTARELPPFFEYKHRIRYYRQEETASLEEIQHPAVRESAKYLKFSGGLEVIHNSDLPARSGLGSSSTFTVGMLHALHGLQGYMPTKRELASQAIYVEQQLIAEAVGSQDQIAAAFGGLNSISFEQGGGFEVRPITLSAARLTDLQEHLLLCFSGFARTASELADIQISRTSQNAAFLSQMTEIAQEGLRVLVDPESNLVDFGHLLNDQWSVKRRLGPGVSNPQIDEIYSRGLKAGAIGGKLLGAGGGGFLLFLLLLKTMRKSNRPSGKKCLSHLDLTTLDRP